MTNEWISTVLEFLLNYWLHSSLFIGLVMFGLKRRWINADRQGEILAKSALLIGGLTAFLFVADWRLISIEQLSTKIDITSTQKNMEGELNGVNPKTANESDLFQLLSNNSQYSDAIISPEPTGNDRLMAESITSKLLTIMKQFWQQGLVFFWIATVCLFFSFKWVNVYLLSVLLKDRKAITDRRLINLMESLTAKLKLTSAVKLFESDQIKSPIVYAKNEIILPLNFSTLYKTNQVEASLAHELAHIQRKDLMWRKLFVFVSSLFYFQPLNRLLIQQLNQIAEQRSDYLAAQWTGKSRALAEALAITADNHFNSCQSQWVPAMKPDKSNLLVRVESLLNPSSKTSHSLIIFVAILFGSILITTLPGCSITHAKTEPFAVAESSIESDNTGYNISVSNRHNGFNMEIDAHLEGKIKFNDEETEILDFPTHSFFDFKYGQGDDDDRRLRIERKGENSTVSYQYYLDGEKLDYNDSAKTWFASVLLELFRRTGFDAKSRVARIKNKKGVEGVFVEVDLINSDSIQGLYLRHLFELTHLSQSDAKRALKLSESVSSDFEHANILKNFVNTQNVKGELWKSVFKTSLKINSDFELSNFLKMTIHYLEDDFDGQDEFFKSAKSINSDSEMKKLFAEFLYEKKANIGFIIKMLSAAKNINSDFELAQLLTLVNEEVLIDDDVFKAYLTLAPLVGSDFELSRVINNIMDSTMDLNRFEKLINLAANNIGSDSELAGVLISSYDKQPMDTEMKAVLLVAANSIGSRAERERVIRKIRG